MGAGVSMPRHTAYDFARSRFQEFEVQDHLPYQPTPSQPIDELAIAEIKSAVLTKLRLAIGKEASMATRQDWYKATALALRDRIVHRWDGREGQLRRRPQAGLLPQPRIPD